MTTVLSSRQLNTDELRPLIEVMKKELSDKEFDINGRTARLYVVYELQVILDAISLPSFKATTWEVVEELFNRFKVNLSDYTHFEFLEVIALDKDTYREFTAMKDLPAIIPIHTACNIYYELLKWRPLAGSIKSVYQHQDKVHVATLIQIYLENNREITLKWLNEWFIDRGIDPQIIIDSFNKLEGRA